MGEFAVDTDLTDSLISFDGSPEVLIYPTDYQDSNEIILNNLIDLSGIIIS